MKMLKNSKSINFIYKNKNQKNLGEEKFPLKYQNYHPKQYQKKEIKYKKSDSAIKSKNSEIINNKQLLLTKRYTMRNKYHKIDKNNENKEKSITKRLNKGNNSYKNLKNPINGKENNFNCFSGRKSSLPKQISLVSKNYNDNLPRTIENDSNDIKDKKRSEKKYGKNLRQSNFQNIKQNKIINKKNNIVNFIYDYQINQLKQVIMKQNIDNCIEKILSNKLKNKNANNKNKLNNTSKNTNNNDSNIYLTSFSPPQKNNILYKMSSNSKTSIFSNTNPSINFNSETNTTNTHANNFKSLNNNNIYIEDKKYLLTNKSPNKKTSEKSCPSFNINNNSTKNIIDSYIIEGNFSKNCSSSNLILRKTAGPCLNSIKGALRPFCSLISIPINNKIKKDKSNINIDSYSTSNENVNYFFDKDKYFNEFKNRMNLNINNLFFKTKRKKWQNIIENKSKIHEKQDIFDRKENFLSEESNNYEFFYSNNERRNSALLTEKINKNDKIVKIKKIKAINLNNNSNNKSYNINKEDFILNDIFLRKRRATKRLSDTDTDTGSNHINLTNFIYAKNKNNKNNNINNKSSFISFNRRTVNENNNFNYNSNFSNCNSNNNKGRNAYNILHNNFFEPQTTIVNKKNKNCRRIINSNSNRNNYTQNKAKDNKSLTIQKNKEKSEVKNAIKSSRNKNIVNEIFGRDNKETYYMRIINELNKYKKEKKAKKKELDTCFLNNSNNNKVNSVINNNIDISKKKKENKQKIKEEIDENKIKENISQNTLSMYTIYILSKYYPHCSKIGLSKITLFDKNGNAIPIICSNTNSNSNNWKNIEALNLFNSIMTNNSPSNGNKNKDFPFIMEYKKNLYINFYIKNVKTNNIDYIQINNYSDLKNDISPVKNIHIFKGNKMIYKGIILLYSYIFFLVVKSLISFAKLIALFSLINFSV